jgi:acetyl-CoA carboxylase biotin carboxyl carrier protein
MAQKPTGKKTTSPTKPAATPKATSLELNLITSLADILNSTGLTEIELEQRGVRVRVSRGGGTSAQVVHYGQPAPAPVAHAPVVALAAPVVATADNPGTVKSPMVGTAYLASGPGAANFVAVGTVVKQGETLLIIEAMKTMNQIPAPRSGTVTSIIIETGQPVEFGEALMVIE